MKKIIYIFLLFLLLCIPSNADDCIEFENDNISDTSTISNNEPLTSSKNIAILDRNTKTIVYGKNPNDKVPMASTTKIMTCIIALEKNKNLNDIVTISKNASKIRGSIIGLNYNEKYPLINMLYGLMLRSGNDAAIAIAEHTAGSVQNFVDLMNEKALELGLYNTHFTSPHGLDNPDHYTTAYELSLLSDYALNNPLFSKIVKTKTYSFSKFNFTNTNELLNNYDGIYGIKTGFTGEAGRCLVTSCKRNNADLICVVLGAGTKSQRTIDSKNLYNYIFNNFEYFDFSNEITTSFKNAKNYITTNINVFNSSTVPSIKLSNPYNTKYLIYSNNTPIQNKIDSRFYFYKLLNPSYKENMPIGKLYIYYDSKMLFSLDLLLENSITPLSFYSRVKNFFTN